MAGWEDLSDFPYDWNIKKEKKAVKELQKGEHGISKYKKSQLLLASWNIANFDEVGRFDECYELIAEIIKPFDLCAIQEIRADIRPLYRILEILGNDYSLLFSDIGARQGERLGYIYKHDRIQPAEQIGEFDIPPASKRKKKFYKGTKNEFTVTFKGYDRQPYVASWYFKGNFFTTYNCHTFYGDAGQKTKEFRRRILEIEYLVNYLDKKIREKPETLYTENIMILGDLNMPSIKKDDPIYKLITKKRFKPLPYHDHITNGSSIRSNSPFDQMVIVNPFKNKIKIKDNNWKIFAFDNVVFRDMWKEGQKSNGNYTNEEFTDYVCWAISDHRPMWAILDFK